MYCSSTGSFEQSHHRGNQNDPKSECIARFDPAVQVHSCYLNNPREKMDLWLATETTFEEMKDKIQVLVKDKDLYLKRSDLLRNVFLMKNCFNEISFVNIKDFFV